MSLTPFPNVFEIIRFVALSLGTKASNKKLDDLCRDVFADYRKVPLQLDEIITEPISKYINEGLADGLTADLKSFLHVYPAQLLKLSADGLERKQVLPILVPHYFVPSGVRLLINVFKQLPGMPSPILLVSNTSSAIESVLQWADGNVDGWQGYIKGLEKEKKDQLARWCRGENLPNLQSVSNLALLDEKELVAVGDWLRMKSLLLMARALDYMRGHGSRVEWLDQARQLMMGAQPEEAMKDHLEKLQRESRARVNFVDEHLAYLHHNLRMSVNKLGGVKGEARHHLNELTQKLKKFKEYDLSAQNIHRLEARWYVFSGELDTACDCYGRAVEAAGYRLGSELENLLKEAFVVAAKQGNGVLLRKLKNTQLLFGLELVSVNQAGINKPSKKVDEFIQPHEINWWAGHFNQIFPRNGFFEGVKVEGPASKLGILLYDTDKDVNPNYRSPNQTIKIGKNWVKLYPQIVWFILHNQIDVVQKLIDKGARMDVETSSGETPLVMALEKLIVQAVPVRPLDDTLFNIIASTPGVEKTVNIQTHKLKLTPIIQAVESGRPEVVRKILALGADPNVRGETDSQTALNVCVKLIGILVRPKEWIEIQLKHPVNDELLDALRRHSNGALGADLKSQEQFLQHPDFYKWMRSYSTFIADRVTEYCNVPDLLNILIQLLKAGANPNAKMSSPVKGYTPLMLAVELDLDDVVSEMLPFNGDLDLQVCSTYTGKMVDCWALADGFKSLKVRRLLSDIRPVYEQNRLIM